MLKRTTLLVLALAALLAAAPMAQADDQSVFDAWTHENPSLANLQDALAKNLKTWQSSNGKKGGPALERISKIRALIARRKKALAAEEPSTTAGKHAQRLAGYHLRDYNAGMLKLRSAINAGMAGNARGANSLLKEYNSLMARAKKYRSQAYDAFKNAELN